MPPAGMALCLWIPESLGGSLSIAIRLFQNSQVGKFVHNTLLDSLVPCVHKKGDNRCHIFACKGLEIAIIMPLYDSYIITNKLPEYMTSEDVE